MEDDFLNMPDGELPSYAEVEAKQEAAQEAAAVAAAEPASSEPAAVVEAPLVTEGKSEAEIQAELEASAATDPEAIAEAEAEKNKPAPVVDPLDLPDGEAKPPVEGESAKPAEEVKPATEAAPEAVPAVTEPTPEEIAAQNQAAFYAKITAPFKANGREMEVKSPEEAVRLMQMGANYNQKMQALKPNLNMMRQLEEAGLLNGESIAQVIDLLKHKKPEAIAALAKSANVDPLDLDEKSVADYKPQPVPHDVVRERLEETLDRIQDRPSYTKVMEQVRNYDAVTKGQISETPVVLEYLEGHMSNGVYDIIDAEVHRRKTFGSISMNTPFLEAYKAVGDDLNSQGAFNHLSKQEAAPAQVTQPPAAPVKTVTAAPVAQATVDERRRAAAPSQPSAPATPKTDFNPLAMSDADFEKMAAQGPQFVR